MKGSIFHCYVRLPECIIITFFSTLLTTKNYLKRIRIPSHSLKLRAKAPENRPFNAPKRKQSYSKHPFPGAFAVSFRLRVFVDPWSDSKSPGTATSSTWMFLKLGGFYPKSSHFNRVFRIFSPSILGGKKPPIFGSTPICFTANDFWSHLLSQEPCRGIRPLQFLEGRCWLMIPMAGHHFDGNFPNKNRLLKV